MSKGLEALNKRKKLPLTCRLGYHRPINKMGFDGCSFTSYCKKCGKELLLDSQGNWFSID